MKSISAATPANKPIGFVLWENENVVVIATGKKSTNRKTGDMVQTYILYKHCEPTRAISLRLDRHVCFDRIHRSKAAGGLGSCYVNVGHGPLAVYRAWPRGRYERKTATYVGRYYAGRSIRIGTYGDPVAAPVGVWENLVKHASNWTGYTHQWRRLRSARWSRLVMASCETLLDVCTAQGKGWRSFWVSDERPSDMVLCPAQKSEGRAQCANCGLCKGSSTRTRMSIVISPHGISQNVYRRALEVLSDR